MPKPKFIKLTDLDSEITTKLNIGVDSIERFFLVTRNSELCPSGVNRCAVVFLKGHGSYHQVSETIEEIERLLTEA